MLPVPMTDSPRKLVAAGMIATLLFVGTFGVWATTMSVASAAVGQGKISSEGNRKAVQHRDGGPIGSVLVREGQKVSKGQPLIELDLAEIKSEEAVLDSARTQYMARIARLRAEFRKDEYIEFPSEISVKSDHNQQIQILLDQEKSFFQARTAAYIGNTNLQKALIQASKAQIASFAERLKATRTQQQLVDQEYEALAPLAVQGLVTKTRTLALQRASAQLQGEIETLNAGVAGEKSKIASADLQILQLEKQRQEEIARDLSETETKIADVQPRLIAARSKLERSVLTAPEDGYVYGLAVFGKGATLTPGQVVLEIVPADDQLIVSVNIDPKDIHRLHPGQQAQIQMLGLPTYDRIMLGGKLVKVSPDRFDDVKTNTSYFKAIVAVKSEDLKLYKIELLPGMPADVLINTGDRKIMRYLLDPILRAYEFALREQ